MDAKPHTWQTLNDGVSGSLKRTTVEDEMERKIVLLATISMMALAPACIMDEADWSEEAIAETSNELSVSDLTFNLPARGGNGGQSGSLNCAPDYVAVGIYGRAGRIIDNLGLTCAPLNTDGSLGASYDTGSRGGTGGNPFRISCPAGQAIVGFHGRSGGKVDRLGLYCSGVVHWLDQGTVQHTSSSVGGSGGSPFADICPFAYVATSLVLRTGKRVDQEQLVCSFINP